MGTPAMETMKQQHNDNLRCTSCHARLPLEAKICLQCDSPVIPRQQVSAATASREDGTLSSERILVFFSYARRDQTLRDQLVGHLSHPWPLSGHRPPITNGVVALA